MAETPAQDKRQIGQRRLAAIMFTDAVGFSARVKQNESLTLRLIKRDFEAITRYCTTNGGQVLKTTGDGLLLSFPTASAAVACAQQVQLMMAHNARKLAPEQVLEHRIGIHLGDVFIDDVDVMGNDVNIAARVLSEAGGGEICVSQTVYDVVKNRLTIKGVYLGARDLKNVGEVPIYKLPLTEEDARVSTEAAQHAAQLASKKNRKPMLAVVVILLLLIGGLAAWAIFDGESVRSLLNRFSSGTTPTTTAAQTTQPVNPAPVIAPPTARFVSTVERNGDWKGTYGSIAALVFGDYPETLPTFPMKIPLERGAGELEVSFAGGSILIAPYGRQTGRIGLQKLKSSDYVLATFGGQDDARVGLRFPDNKLRRITFYFAHPGLRDANRNQIVSIVDPATHGVLATQTIKNFQEGMYVSFDVSGAAALRIHSVDQSRAVVSGIFIDPVPAK